MLFQRILPINELIKWELFCYLVLSENYLAKVSGIIGFVSYMTTAIESLPRHQFFVEFDGIKWNIAKVAEYKTIVNVIVSTLRFPACFVKIPRDW